MTTLALFRVNPEELILLLLIILLLFGSKRIPDLARSLGRSIGEFKKGRAEGEQEARDAEAKKIEAEKAQADKADAGKLSEKK